MQGMRVTRSIAVATVAFLSVALLAVAPMARAQETQSKGWVGIVITTGIGQTDRNGSMIFNDYPVIESIEPGSPAERAGLLAGDLIVSINSQDMKKNPVPPRAMLEPGQRVLFRYRRNHAIKSTSVLIEPRPAGNPQTLALSIIGSVPGQGRSEAGPNQQRVTIGQSARPMVEISPLAMPTGTPSIGIFGALLTQLNADMRDALSVKGNGLFVINVEMDSPAGEAGLKSGDVILKAGGEAIGNPAELIRIMRAATENNVRLQLIRKRKQQIVTLRW
ncbi:MAG: PDZ domain-containing protein [Gemmatimonadaceae bacterium]